MTTFVAGVAMIVVSIDRWRQYSILIRIIVQFVVVTIYCVYEYGIWYVCR